MQLMTWQIARLGSRLGFVFEPYQRRVLHSGLGRFLDQPLDLAVGIIRPDGSERVLPFTATGEKLYACEQFERVNSITFRGYDPDLGLKFELNLHSPFYPQNEKICLLPAMYVELRVTWAHRVRWLKRTVTEPPEQVRLFIRIARPDTQITVASGRIDMRYDVPLVATYERSGYDAAHRVDAAPSDAPTVTVFDRLQSVTEGAQPLAASTSGGGGRGLALDLPVTPEGSGTKWRLIWGTHCAQPIMQVRHKPAKLRYNQYWSNLDEVMTYAQTTRDDNLAHSRRFEKLLEQAPFIAARRHIIAQGFHSYLANTFWCDVEGDATSTSGGEEWFSNWEGSCLYHSTVDVEYNVALFYFTCWPRLLKLTLNQWTGHGKLHTQSGGKILSHDMGVGLTANGQAYHHDMPVEENCDFLLLCQSYCHWTGDDEPLKQHAAFIKSLTQYLIWTDRDGSGFPSEGTANTIDDASPAVQYARRQTYLAVKRIMALLAAADLLSRAGDEQTATQCRDVVRHAVPKIEHEAWLGDHYAVCIDKDTSGLTDVWTGKPLPIAELTGWDDYSIYTSNGLLLPAMIGKQSPFDARRVTADLTSGIRETQSSYGCGHCSSDTTNVWVSQNLWRDLTGRYTGAVVPPLDSRYWDLQTFSNTGEQSFGFIDTYVGNELAFYPRGAVAFGHYLAGPRIRIDRLNDRGSKITIRPDRFRHSRWPLLPLADWEAGKIPVCVVDGLGNVTIEGEIESVTIVGNDEQSMIEP
ncbi:MAG: DUF4965 domain-containing protein [Phycisphaeraceae bacterium]